MLRTEIEQAGIGLGQEIHDLHLALGISKEQGRLGERSAPDLRAGTHARMVDHRPVISRSRPENATMAREREEGDGTRRAPELRLDDDPGARVHELEELL